MKQFFLLGASSVYGVGGEDGGWADLFKKHVHKKMYGKYGVGEKYEVYNFSKSGATVQFVLDTFPEQIKQYGRDGDIVCIVSVGGNNSKAIKTPDNYVSSVKEYTNQMKDLFKLLKNHSNHVVFVSSGYIDEKKTNPKISPFDGSKSYFTNKRRLEFHYALKKLCEQTNVEIVDVDTPPKEWQEKYLYIDGLHPNNNGHQLIYQKLINVVNI